MGFDMVIINNINNILKLNNETGCCIPLLERDAKGKSGVNPAWSRHCDGDLPCIMPLSSVIGGCFWTRCGWKLTAQYWRGRRKAEMNQSQETCLVSY